MCSRCVDDNGPLASLSWGAVPLNVSGELATWLLAVAKYFFIIRRAVRPALPVVLVIGIAGAGLGE